MKLSVANATVICYNTIYSVLYKNIIHYIAGVTMNNYSVFDGINSEEIKILDKCLNFEERNYSKGDIILNYVDTPEIVGIMQKGLACLVSIGKDGETNMIDYYEPGNMFGYQFSMNIGMNLYCIIAKTECSVKFYNYDKMIVCCQNNCQKHIKLINNLIFFSIGKVQAHTEILSQRTIRNKLLTYFLYIKEIQGTNEIKIPFSLSDLASYLAVDRSAMMRELKKMNNEKMIISKGHTITII